MWLAPSPLFAKGAPKLNIADVFSTDLYTGTGAAQTITNGIDLSGEGGLVWAKNRDVSFDHALADTLRGGNRFLVSNLTNAESSSDNPITFNSNGFSYSGAFGGANQTSLEEVAWTFRRAPKFFDVVTYTGNGTAGRTIAHNLGVVPGMIVTKRRDTTSGWFVYHRANTADPETDYLRLNTTDATADFDNLWSDTAPTDTHFTIGSDTQINFSGGTYVAYLFAHDPDPSGVIQCGSYTGNGSTTGPVIDLGWEPQYLLIKGATIAREWQIRDSQRDTTNPNNTVLKTDSSDAEASGPVFDVDFLSTGFQIKNDNAGINAGSYEYIYLAVRAEGA